jgi:hypothetical protein
MRTNLPIIKICLKDIDSENDVSVHDRDINGKLVTYTYRVIANIDFNSVIRNNITKIKVTALSSNAISDPGKLISKTSIRKNKTSLIFGDSKTIDGLVLKDGKEDSGKAYTGFIQSSDNKSPSPTSQLADSMTRLKYDTSAAFYTYTSKRELETLDFAYEGIESFINTQVRDYAISKKSSLTDESTTKTSSKSHGLTGKISASKKSYPKIKGIVLDEFETKLVKSSELAKLKHSPADSITLPMSDTVLVEGISKIMQKKYGTLQKKEWRKNKKENIVKERIGSKFNNDVKSYQSDLESQIERGSKDLETSTASSFQSAAWKAINLSSKSPSQLIMSYSRDPVISSDQNFKGVLSSGQKALQITSLEASFAKILSSRFKISSTARKSTQGDSRAEYQAVQARKVLKDIAIPVNVSFENRAAIDGIVIKIDAINQYGQIVDSKSQAIDHREKIKNFYTTSVAPSLSAKLNSSGKIQVSVRQIDKDASDLYVYRKYISEKSISDGEEFILIKKFSGTSASDESGEKEFFDTLDKIYGSKIMYRAVSFTKSGGGSGSFSDFILDLSGLSNSSNRSSADFLQGSITCKVQEEGIFLSIPAIFGDRSAVFIEKKSQEDGYKSIERIFNSKDRQRSSQISSMYTFLDRDVNHGCTYRYNIMYITEHGTEKRLQHASVEYRFVIGKSGLSVNAENSSKKNRTIKSSVKLSMNIGDIIVLDAEKASKAAIEEYSKSRASEATSKEAASKIAQEISKETREARGTRIGSGDESLLSDYLKSRGKDLDSAGAEFKNKVEESIYSIEVQRVDLKTGDVTDIGIFMPGEVYEDDKDLIPGRTYEYKFQELKMPLSTYTEIVSKTSAAAADKEFRSGKGLLIDKDKTDKGIEFEDNYRSKFLDHSSIVDGVVRSSKSRARSATTTLQRSKSGVSKSVHITIPKSNSVIKNPNVLIVSNKRVFISWILSSSKNIKNKSDVDFFLITASKLGQVYPVLTCHGQSIDSGMFVSIDDTQDSFLGEISYFITPIYNNATLGDTISAGTVVMR